MTPAEAELFDAQFTESPDPRKNFVASSQAIILPSVSSAPLDKLAPTSTSSSVAVDGQNQVGILKVKIKVKNPFGPSLRFDVCVFFSVLRYFLF